MQIRNDLKVGSGSVEKNYGSAIILCSLINAGINLVYIFKFNYNISTPAPIRIQKANRMTLIRKIAPCSMELKGQIQCSTAILCPTARHLFKSQMKRFRVCRKHDSSNPYILKLSILDEEIVLHGYSQVLAS